MSTRLSYVTFEIGRCCCLIRGVTPARAARLRFSLAVDLDITVFTFYSAFRDSLRLHACCFLGVVYYVLGPCCHSVLVHYTYSARALFSASSIAYR